MIHIAGGSSRGFNERFSTPSANNLSRVFPYTDLEQTDHETGVTDGLLTKARQAGVVPKVFYTSSSWEYWGSIASGIHTSLDGNVDFELPDSSRACLLAGTQHVPPAFPPRFTRAPTTRPTTGAEIVTATPERGQAPLNPLNYRAGAPGAVHGSGSVGAPRRCAATEPSASCRGFHACRARSLEC